MKKSKICLCLHGKVGGKSGKHSHNDTCSEEVLEIAYKHNKEFILDKYNVDIFVHSWSVDLADEIVNLYNPLRHHIEEQIQFDIPPYIQANKDRTFAHLSRWYSFAEVVDMVSEYIEISKKEEVDIVYDHVIVQRFDLCWNITPDFKNMDNTKFWVGKSTLNTKIEWSDRWFSSSFENMYKFSKLFDKIPEYMNNGPLPSIYQYGGISSHKLSKFHAETIGLDAKFKYNFGGYSQKPNDYNEARRQYFGDDK